MASGIAKGALFLYIRQLFYKFRNRYIGHLGAPRFLFINNVFGTSFQRHALLSYLPDPFVKQGFSEHSNFQEITEICSSLKEQKFNVDVIHYLDGRILNYSKYDYILGFGAPFNNSHLTSCKAVKILIATGAHYCFQTNAELKRINEFYIRTNWKVRPRRINPYNWGESFLSEYMILTGNDWTVSTYETFYKRKIFKIPVTAIDYYSGKEFRRNWDTAKKHFLWFGSSGLIHKGLDLCIEAFSKTNDLVLHICGSREEDFFEAYEIIINSNKDIRYHGFLDVCSNEFRELVMECGFVILPSCSEGQAGSVITAMFSGLLPVVTMECGIDLLEFVFPIDHVQVEHIEDLILLLSEIESNTLNQKSNQCREYVLKNHTLKQYSNIFRHIFEQILHAENEPNYFSAYRPYISK